VFLIYSERAHTRSEPMGRQPCLVCASPQAFTHQIETNDFCVFGWRLFVIEEVANYLQCDTCETTYNPGQMSRPAQLDAVQLVLAYLLIGYGKARRLDLAVEIVGKITSLESPVEELRSKVRMLEAGVADASELLAEQAGSLNEAGKEQVVMAAFLATHACCEMQYADRQRINRLGAILGLSGEMVEAAIRQARRANYFGVQRRLIGQSQPG
jgi:hypothetical protein